MYLSKGGRVIPIKSTLSKLPTYFMSFFPLLAGVANHIEKFQCDFIWGGLGEEFKYNLVRWSKVCSPISLRKMALVLLAGERGLVKSGSGV
jgi:hypothetical protein